MSELDDLTIPSLTEKEPLFSIKNIFKPTPRKEIIVGMFVKMVCIGFLALGATLLGMVAIIDEMKKTLLISGIICNLIGFIGGAIGEMIILFTKEQPISSLLRAAEDIQINPQQVIPQQLNPTTDDCEQPIHGE